ncbi:MAG: hypothetical protein ACOY94_00340 [Bacillota bacterium]
MRIDPNLGAAWAAMAYALACLNPEEHGEAAEEALSRALSLTPVSAEVCFWQAEYCQVIDDPYGAREGSDQALALSPDVSRYWAQSARIATLLGEASSCSTRGQSGSLVGIGILALLKAVARTTPGWLEFVYPLSQLLPQALVAIVASDILLQEALRRNWLRFLR